MKQYTFNDYFYSKKIQEECFQNTKKVVQIQMTHIGKNRNQFQNLSATKSVKTFLKSI